jgi:hypothetical protein
MGLTNDQARRAEEWLDSRDTGISSESMFHYMALGIHTGGPPSDPADLGRCLRLLDRFPEWKPRVAEIAAVGRGWERIAPVWSDLEASFIEEAGGKLPGPYERWRAPQTYRLMKQALGQTWAFRAESA